MFTVDEAKAMSRRLRSALARRGHIVNHSEALELVASQLGHRDWNTARAMLAHEADVTNTVTPAPASSTPKVTGTSPTQGSVVDASSRIISVTFDRPMLPGSFSFCRASAETYPNIEGDPVQSPDGCTYSIPCTLQAGREYAVWFNRLPYMNFRGLDGTSAEPYLLMFCT